VKPKPTAKFDRTWKALTRVTALSEFSLLLGDDV